MVTLGFVLKKELEYSELWNIMYIATALARKTRHNKQPVFCNSMLKITLSMKNINTGKRFTLLVRSIQFFLSCNGNIHFGRSSRFQEISFAKQSDIACLLCFLAPKTVKNFQNLKCHFTFTNCSTLKYYKLN